MTTTTCGNCGQAYAVVLSTSKAHPGSTTPNTLAGTRASDQVFNHTGDRVPGATIPASNARFVSAGPSATIVHRDVSAADAEASWACLCGATVTHRYPRTFLVACIHGATPDHPVCRKREANTATMPTWSTRQMSHSCPCCGHQGTHWVRWGETAPCGASAATSTGASGVAP